MILQTANYYLLKKSENFVHLKALTFEVKLRLKGEKERKEKYWNDNNKEWTGCSFPTTFPTAKGWKNSTLSTLYCCQSRMFSRIENNGGF